MATKSKTTTSAAPAHKKANKHEVKDKVVQKTLVGRKVFYIGTGGTFFTCPVCAKKVRKGMASQFQEKLYCSESCVLKENE